MIRRPQGDRPACLVYTRFIAQTLTRRNIADLFNRTVPRPAARDPGVDPRDANALPADHRCSQ
jgi:hypothetical protein